MNAKTPAQDQAGPAVGARLELPVRPAAWIGGDGHPRHIDAVQTATDWTVYGKWAPLYDKAALDASRTKALQDAARWVDEEVGHALQDGWSVEAVQALMATRDMLRAHADMRATPVKVKA